MLLTRVFWSALVAYINDEYSLLTSFKLKPLHIMLLLSNQIFQICDDVSEAWGNAASVDPDNKDITAVQFAWVSLQAYQVIAGYQRNKYKYHQAINDTFVSFLPPHMTDQPAIRLKSTCDALQAKVKA